MRFAIATLLATTTSSVKINGVNYMQTEADIPDYWNDHRFLPTYTWEATNNPRYGNETSWVEDTPKGQYADTVGMSDSEVSSRQNKFGKYHEAGNKHNWKATFLQTEESEGTYPAKDSASYITPYNQRDHAWNEPQYDVSNETHWVVSSPRGSHLNVSRPLYHEIVNGTIGGGVDEISGVDQHGYDNHFNEPAFMMTMSEALE